MIEKYILSRRKLPSECPVPATNSNLIPFSNQVAESQLSLVTTLRFKHLNYVRFECYRMRTDEISHLTQTYHSEFV